MESKLLKAAKAFVKYKRDFPQGLTMGTVEWSDLNEAIREAEAAHVCIYPADGAPCSVCHKPVTVAAPTPKPDVMKVKFNASTGAETYDSSNVKVGVNVECPGCGTRLIGDVVAGRGTGTPPKPDPWACKYGPDGRCQNKDCFWRDKDSINNIVKDGVFMGTIPITSCPTDTEQKPAPARRTNLEVAAKMYLKAYAEHPDHVVAMRAALEAIGVNPDEVEG